MPQPFSGEASSLILPEGWNREVSGSVSSRIQSPWCRGCHVPGAGVTSQSSSASPCALLPPPCRQVGRQRQAGAVGFHLPISSLLWQPTRKYIKSYITKHHSTTTGGVCHTSLWLGLCVLAVGQWHTAPCPKPAWEHETVLAPCAPNCTQ